MTDKEKQIEEMAKKYPLTSFPVGNVNGGTQSIARSAFGTKTESTRFTDKV